MCINRQRFTVCGCSNTNVTLTCGIFYLMVAIGFAFSFGPISRSLWTLSCIIPGYLGLLCISIKCYPDSLQLRRWAYYQAVILTFVWFGL